MQVKVFDCSHEKDLEEEVNDFLDTLDDNQVIDIKYQVSSFYDNREQIYIFSAMVIFKI